MARWVLLGSSALTERVARDRAAGDLVVVAETADRLEALAEAGVTVRTADPTDPATLRAVGPAAVVAALDADGSANRRALEAAREALPDAHLVGYAGDDAVARDALEGLADQVLDPVGATAELVLDRVGSEPPDLRRLHRVLRSIDKLAVLTHDNPDPDAIASAVALERIAEAVGTSAEVCYFGDISHQENRAFVNLLSYDLRRLDDDEATTEEFDGLALVDHSRPGVNDRLPPDVAVDIVIDHHPPRFPVDATFVDLRSDVGATSTLLTQYLSAGGIGFPEDVATGLLFGIRVDTDEFTREVSPADFAAASTLVPQADLGLLEKVESPSVSGDTLETLGDAIRNRRLEGPVLLSCVGRLADRDALAQAADRLLTLDGVETAIVYGVREGTIYVSARSRGTELDLGETLRDAFDRIGSAGGHADMAGAQVTLGVLEALEDREESLLSVVESVVDDRLLEAIEANSERRIRRYPTMVPALDEYAVAEEHDPNGS